MHFFHILYAVRILNLLTCFLTPPIIPIFQRMSTTFSKIFLLSDICFFAREHNNTMNDLICQVDLAFQLNLETSGL